MKLIPSVVLALLVTGRAPLPADDSALVVKCLDGQEHRPLAAGDRKAVVLFFVSPYCPTSNTFVPEMNRIAADYRGDFAFYFVHADRELKPEDILLHTERNSIKDPVLPDEGRRLTRHTKATVTPEAVVIGPDGRTLYQGRINDLYLSPTKRQRQATTRELRDALDAIRSGKPPPVAGTEAAGCRIDLRD